jgi:hypothetical protein
MLLSFDTLRTAQKQKLGDTEREREREQCDVMSLLDTTRAAFKSKIPEEGHS